MDAHLFRLFTSIASPILNGALIGKIQAPAPDLLTILFLAASGKRYLVLRYGRQSPFCYFSALRLSAQGHPAASIMRLRKYLSGKRVASVVPQFCQRKLWLLASGSHATASDAKSIWLCLDLAHGPSLHFLDAEDAPLEEQPLWPEDVAGALENWHQWPVLTPPLRKTLHLLAMPDQKALLRDLETGDGDIFIYSDPSGRIKSVSAWPLPEGLRENLGEKATSSLMDSFTAAGDQLVGDAFFNSGSDKARFAAGRRKRQLMRTMANLDADEERLKKMAASEPDALALQANLWRWNSAEHREYVSVPAGGETRTIALDQRFDIITNMKRLFKTTARGKRGLALLEGRREAISRELAALDETPYAHSSHANTAKEGVIDKIPAKSGKATPKNISLFASSDGYQILRGKDARGNRAIRKISNPHDIWVHVEHGPGAHVVIRRQNPSQPVPATTMEEAGALAANKSWLANQDQAPVMYAEMRHVKPIHGKGEGMVSIDKIAKTMLVPVNPDLERKLAPQPAMASFL